jgi:hypothetical protein
MDNNNLDSISEISDDNDILDSISEISDDNDILNNISEISDDNDILDNISEISDIKEDKIFFSIKFKSNECLSDTESINSSNTSNTSNTYDTYDTFDTSDSQILKKQDIKIKLLKDNLNESKHINSFKTRDEFKYIFKSMLDEVFKPKTTEININVITCTDDSKLDSEDSLDSYLYGYKFF